MRRLSLVIALVGGLFTVPARGEQVTPAPPRRAPAGPAPSVVAQAAPLPPAPRAEGTPQPQPADPLAGQAPEAAPPPSDAAWQTFRGKVIVSDIILAPPSEYANEEVKVVSLKRVQRASVAGAEGFWRLHFVAFLELPAVGDTVNLVAYETGEKRHPVKLFEVPVKAGAREVHLNNFVVSESMGFRRGQSYDLVVELGQGKDSGKEDVTARGMITLR